MSPKTVIVFGGIGTVVETSQLQFEAFNAAFRSLGIDAAWAQADYRATLSSSGGGARLATVRTATGAALTAAEIAAVHAEKTRIFDAGIVARGLTLRDGVANILDLARERGLTLAWATTTLRDNVDAIFAAVGDALPRAAFAWIGDASRVERQKPDPEAYRTVLRDLGVDAAAALAIEDSPIGVASARAAGLFTVAFPGAWHGDTDFSGADRVVATLDEIAPLLA